jgi:GNAT superfamily N-acetyltransferase
MQVRQASLGDAGAISEVYKSLVKQWKRADDPQSLRYDELGLFDRWQYGGPWFSVETCAVWLGHLIERNDGIPLVAELDNEIVGHAEVFIAQEAEPYQHHINISIMCVKEGAHRKGVGTALVRYVEQMAAVLNCQRVTIAYPDPQEFFGKLGYTQSVARHRLTLSAEEGRVFYKARDLADDSPEQIQNWFMPLGRFQNSREEWERMYWKIWSGVPELVEARWHRLHIDLTGQPGILHLHQHREDPEMVTARLWTKNQVSTHILSAVRDRAARLDYQRITTIVDADTRPLLKDAKDQYEVQWLYAKPVNAEI